MLPHLMRCLQLDESLSGHLSEIQFTADLRINPWNICIHYFVKSRFRTFGLNHYRRLNPNYVVNLSRFVDDDLYRLPF